MVELIGSTDGTGIVLESRCTAQLRERLDELVDEAWDAPVDEV